MSTYQPLWRDGQTTGESIRDADGRCTVIEQVLRQGNLVRPGFTLLDVGAQSGYFSVRLSQTMGAVATAIDGELALMEGLEAMGPHGVAGVMKFLKPGDLRLFRPVDVGLCLSVLHHVTWWEEMLEELLDLCRIVFVECAMPEEEIGKESELLAAQHEKVSGLKDAMLTAWTPGYDATVLRPMYLVPGRR